MKRNILLLQTRHIESISYLSTELMKAFPKDRYHITLVYLENGEPCPGDEFADECIFLGLDKTDYKGLRLKAIKKLRMFLANRHFDVIIANMYKPINLLMQLRHSIKASLCIGIIHAFGEFDRWGRRLMMRWMLDSRWRIVGVSHPLCRYLIDANCGLHKGNTFAINNAVDVKSTVHQALEKSSARNKLGLPVDGVVFGTVGRTVKGKRQLELIKAFHKFAANRKDVYLCVIGDGELYDELKAYVDRHQLRGNIFLVGRIPQAVHYLRAFDVFVFPSEQEGFGIALLEAMALSLPVIVNRVEPLVTIAGDTNIVVDTSDIDSFANALGNSFNFSTDILKQKGMDNYRRVCSEYDIAIYKQAYLDLVDSHFKQMTI